MRRFKIKTTLSAIFVGIALMVATFAAYALDRLRAVDDKVGEVANVWMPTLEKVKDIEVRLGDIRTAYRNHILQPDDAGKRAAVKLIEQSVELLESDTLALQRSSSNDTQRVLLRKIETSFAEYMSKGREVLVLSSSGREDEAAKWLREVMMKRAEDLRNASAQLSQVTRTRIRGRIYRGRARLLRHLHCRNRIGHCPSGRSRRRGLFRRDKCRAPDRGNHAGDARVGRWPT